MTLKVIIFVIMQSNKFNNIFYWSDYNGCAFFRGLMATETCWSFGPQTGVGNSVISKPVFDEKFYAGINMLMVQRLVADETEQLFDNWFVPLSHKYRFWTVFNIDDLTDYRFIPMYNRGRRAFIGDKAQGNIKKMMNNSDFILTTTGYLRQKFHECYDIPLENILCIPNLLPRWWIGSYFHPKECLENFRAFKKKPRVGIVSSLSHYNISGVKQDKNGLAAFEDKNPDGSVVWHNEKNEVVDEKELQDITDDFDTVIDVIRKTIDEVQWVVFGYSPPKLEKEIKAGKIEIHPAVPIMNYPAALNALHLNAIVAPLVADSEFNKSKSNIKFLESCAIGVPLYAPDMITYSPYMPKAQLYSSSDELLEKVLKLKSMSSTVFEDIIRRQYRFLNSPFQEVQCSLKNWWLEDNMDIWMKLFRLPYKSMLCSLDKFREVKEREENDKKEAEKTAEILLQKPENGIEILK